MEELIEAILSKMSDYPSIPRLFIEHTKHILTDRKCGHYYNTIIGNPSDVVKGIGDLFQEVEEYLKISPEDLLKQSSFNMNDYDTSKIPSLFAELRAILYLRNEGFDNVQFLKDSKRRCADLIATKDGLKYAIEVTNAGYQANQGYWKHDDIVFLMNRKLEDEQKYDQLKDTCDKKMR